MEDKARTINLAEAAALIDEHMGGCPALQRLVELLAAHYPNTPMPIVSRTTEGIGRSGPYLHFIRPGQKYGVYVGYGYSRDDRICEESFSIYESGNFSGRALTEEHAAMRLSYLLECPPTTLRQKLAAVLS